MTQFPHYEVVIRSGLSVEWWGRILATDEADARVQGLAKARASKHPGCLPAGIAVQCVRRDRADDASILLDGASR